MPFLFKTFRMIYTSASIPRLQFAAFMPIYDISAQQTQHRTFRRNKLGAGQTRHRSNSAQAKLFTSQTFRKSNSAQAQVRIGAEKK